MQSLQTIASPPLALPSRGEQLVHRLIEELGEDPSREGLL